jgi:hypothetical protein
MKRGLSWSHFSSKSTDSESKNGQQPHQIFRSQSESLDSTPLKADPPALQVEQNEFEHHIKALSREFSKSALSLLKILAGNRISERHVNNNQNFST